MTRWPTDAAWEYPDSPIDELRGHLRFEWGAMDAWFEEDEEVFVHPRDPYSRVDILTSSRHVEVDVGGVRLADTHRPTLLFETGLPARYYVPKVDVRLDLLRPSPTTSACPYKGFAQYWSVVTPTGVEDDLRVGVPDAAAREPEDRRAGLLLQRAGRPDRRRRTADPPEDEVLVTRRAPPPPGCGPRARPGTVGATPDRPSPGGGTAWP